MIQSMKIQVNHSLNEVNAEDSGFIYYPNYINLLFLSLSLSAVPEPTKEVIRTFDHEIGVLSDRLGFFLK